MKPNFFFQQCIHETRKREDAERQLETYKGDKTNDDLLKQIKTGREQNDQLRFQIQTLVIAASSSQLMPISKS